MLTANPPSPQERLHQRYGGHVRDDPYVWNEIVDHLLSHRSVRRFLPTPVTEAQLHSIIAAAQSAPTTSNLNAWSVVAVSDPAIRNKLSEFVGNQPQVAQAPLQLVWLADLSMLERLSADRNFPVVGLDYFEAFLIGALDASFAAQNASVAAQSLGLATNYIGGIRNRIEDVAALLALPPRVAPIFGMCVGTADPKFPADVKPRPPQSLVLHRDKYDSASALHSLERFDDAMKRFYAGQSMKGDWIMKALRRVATPEALTGRDKLRESLHRMGFPLK